MNEKLEIARMATDLTIALIQDNKNGLFNRLSGQLKLGQNGTVLDLLDAIHDHLAAKLTPQ